MCRLIISNFPQCIVQLSAFFQGEEFVYLHVYCFQLKEREFEDYNPWGRPGGGAPIRTQSGKVVADFKEMTKVSLCTGVLMSTMLTWHIWHRCLLKLSLPFYCKSHLFTVLKDNNKSQQNILYFRHSLMLLWLKMNVTIAVFARVVINRVGPLLPRYMILRFRENMPQCLKGFLGNCNQKPLAKVLFMGYVTPRMYATTVKAAVNTLSTKVPREYLVNWFVTVMNKSLCPLNHSIHICALFSYNRKRIENTQPSGARF